MGGLHVGNAITIRILGQAHEVELENTGDSSKHARCVLDRGLVKADASKLRARTRTLLQTCEGSAEIRPLGLVRECNARTRASPASLLRPRQAPPGGKRDSKRESHDVKGFQDSAAIML